MPSLDPVTRAAYNATSSATARAQLVIDTLTAPVAVKVYDDQGVERASGLMSAPWATRNGAAINIGAIASFNVTNGGTPGPGWYLQFESGSRYLRGTFGLAGSGAEFAWRMADFTTGAMANIGTAAVNALEGEIVLAWTSAAGYPISLPSSGGTYDLSQHLAKPPGETPTYSLDSPPTGVSVDPSTGTLVVQPGTTGGPYTITARAAVSTAAPLSGAAAASAQLTGTASIANTARPLAGAATAKAIMSGNLTGGAALGNSWAARKSEAGVVFAHRFDTTQSADGTNAELLSSYIAPTNADYGDDVVLGVHPPALCPRVGTEPNGKTYFETTLIGAVLAEDMPSATLLVRSNGALTPNNNTTGILTLPTAEVANLALADIFSTFKITSGPNAGRFLRANGDPVDDGLGNTTISVTAGSKQPALVADSGFAWQYCKTGDPSNPLQTIHIDENIAVVGRNWPNPSKPAWNPANPTVIPTDVYTIVVQYETGSIQTNDLNRWKDKLAVYSVQPHATNPNWTTLVVRRAAIPGNKAAGRIEQDQFNQSFPCDFPAGAYIGRDNKGGWSRTLAPLQALDNGLPTADPGAGIVTPKKLYRVLSNGSRSKVLKFRSGYYGHADYHGIWSPADPFLPNTIATNGGDTKGPYNGDELYLSWQMKYAPAWGLTDATSKTWFLDNYQQERNSQIVGGAPTLGELRWKWYHNKGDAPNSDLTEGTSYQPGSAWAATCVVGALKTAGACWEPPLGEYFAIKLHIKAGHDNEIEYLFKDNVTLAAVVTTTTPSPTIPDPFVVRTNHFPLRPGMTWNMDGTGGYFCTQAGEGNPQIGTNAQGKPIGLDPQMSGYFNEWALDIAISATNTSSLYGSFKILSHVVVDGVSEFTLTKKKPTDPWPTSYPVVGAQVKVGWLDRNSARYNDTYIKLYKYQQGDADWVLLSDMQHPISYAKGAAPSENPPGWNEWQPTGYANVDDNNMPPNLTKYTRHTELIVSHHDILKPDEL